VPQIIEVCPVNDLPPGAMRLVEWEDLEIGVFNCAGNVYAIEDRCSHDDGPLVEGELDQETCTVECPRHGSRFDLAGRVFAGSPASTNLVVPPYTYEGPQRLVIGIDAANQKGAA